MDGFWQGRGGRLLGVALVVGLIVMALAVLSIVPRACGASSLTIGMVPTTRISKPRYTPATPNKAHPT